MQTAGLLTSLLGMALVAAAIAFVVVRSEPRDEDPAITRQGYRIRSGWLLSLCVVGVLVAAWSLTPRPHQTGLTGAPPAIDVAGRQWFWDIASRTARAGEEGRSRVTWADVSHGCRKATQHRCSRRVTGQI